MRSFGVVVCFALCVAFASAAVGQHRHPWSAGLAWTLAACMVAIGEGLAPPAGRPVRVAIGAAATLAIGIPAGLLIRPLQKNVIDPRAISCIDAAHALGVEILTYAADHDDRLPLTTNWRTAAEIPLNPSLKCPDAASPWTYALNKRIGGHKVVGLDPSASLIFEASAFGPDAAGGPAWFATRHAGRGTVLSVAGNAGLKRPEEVRWNP